MPEEICAACSAILYIPGGSLTFRCDRCGYISVSVKNGKNIIQ